MTDETIHRDLGRHDAEIEGLKHQIEELKRDVEEVQKSVANIEKMFSELIGGKKAVFWLVSISAALGAAISKFIGIVITHVR